MPRDPEFALHCVLTSATVVCPAIALPKDYILYLTPPTDEILIHVSRSGKLKRTVLYSTAQSAALFQT